MASRPAAVPRPQRRGQHRGPSRDCCRSPSTPTTGARAASTSISPTPTATRGSRSSAARDPTRPSPTRQRGARSCTSTSRSRTTTAACCCSGPTATSTSGSATAARPATRCETARTWARCSARSSASTPSPRARRPYSIPESNPFVDRPGARPEIYAYGLRNPWRFSFDSRGGALAIGDVGQDTLEEVDLVARSDSAGRQLRLVGVRGRPSASTTTSTRPARSPPVLEYPLEGEACAVTGGYVVRDEALRSLYGRYLYADFCRGELRSFPAEPGQPARDDRALGPPGAAAELVRRGRRRPDLRGLAGGPGVPARAATRARDTEARRGSQVFRPCPPRCEHRWTRSPPDALRSHSRPCSCSPPCSRWSGRSEASTAGAAARPGAARAASCCRRSAAFDNPSYVADAPGLQEAAVRHRAAGPDRGAAKRQAAARTRSSTSPTRCRSRPRTGSTRSPSRPTTGRSGASTSTTPTTTATCGSTSSSAAAARTRRRTRARSATC